MKEILKFIGASLLSAMMLFSFSTPGLAEDLNDIDGSYASDAIRELVNRGIINGTGNGSFKPTGNITREDFTLILARALNLDLSQQPSTSTFDDVPPTHYSEAAIQAAARAGLINGYGGGRFGFGDNLSRQDMAVLFVRALGTEDPPPSDPLPFSDADQISDYAKDSVGKALELGLITGSSNGTFDPQGAAERQQAALVASKFLKAKQELDNQNPDDGEDGENGDDGGGESPGDGDDAGNGNGSSPGDGSGSNPGEGNGSNPGNYDDYYPPTPTTKICPDGSIVSIGEECKPTTKVCSDGSIVSIGEECKTTTKVCPNGSIVSIEEKCYEDIECPDMNQGSCDSGDGDGDDGSGKEDDSETYIELNPGNPDGNDKGNDQIGVEKGNDNVGNP